MHSLNSNPLTDSLSHILLLLTYKERPLRPDKDNDNLTINSDIWDTDYNSDNWKTEFITIFVDVYLCDDDDNDDDYEIK